MMTFDLDFAKDGQRLMASGACIAVGALAAGLGDTTSPAGLMAGVLAGLGSNVMATDISSRLARRLGRSQQASSDSELSKAVGRAIELVIDEVAASGHNRTVDDRRHLKTLAKKATALWGELAPLRAEGQDLSPLAEGSLVGLLTLENDGHEQPSPLEPAVWAEVVYWMAQKQGISLRPATIHTLADELHHRFTAVLRKILEQDFASDGQAYASLQILIWGELVRSLAELRLDSAELRADQQEGFAAIVDEVTTVTRQLDRLHEGHGKILGRLADVAAEIQGLVHDGNQQILGKLEQILAAMPGPSARTTESANGDHTSPTRTPAPSIALPPQRNPRYVSRNDKNGYDVLAALHGKLKTERHVVLHGMPAVGKTEVAREFVHRNSAESNYPVQIYWTPAGTEDQLLAGLSGMARRMGLPTDRPVVEILDAIKAHLEHHDGWLWVVEGVEDFAMAYQYLPAKVAGQVLITTTCPEAEFRSLGAAHVELTHFIDRDEGASFLLRLAGLMAFHEGLSQAHPEDIAAARGISDEVGGLPLALDQAAAFIEATGGGPREYLERYRQRGEELRKNRSPIGDRDHLSVTLTFLILFGRLEEEHPSTADMLRLLAMFAPGMIPEEILTAGSQALGDRLGSAVSESLPETRMHAIRDRLINYDFRERIFSFHVLVRDVLLDGLDGEVHRKWAERAVRAINLAVPEVNDLDLATSNRMLRHLEECSRLIDRHNFTFPEAGRVLDKTGCYLFYNSRFSESLRLLDRALTITESAIGSGHPDTARTLNNKAILLQRRGDLSEAELLFIRALGIRERELGSDDRVTAITLGNLSCLKLEQKQYVEAEKLARRSLRIRREKLGSEHPETALGMANLGSILSAQGNFSEAERLFRESLAIRRVKSGMDHPWTAGCLKLLATNLTQQGRQPEAESLFNECLSSGGAKPGQDDHGRASILFEAAKLRIATGNLTQAEPMLREALAILMEKLGRNHLETASCMAELSILLCQQGRFSEAEDLLRNALETTKARMGPDDELTANRMGRLGVILFSQRKYKEAEEMFLGAWKALGKSLGKKHKTTKNAQCDYVMTLKLNKRHAKFESELKKLDSNQINIVTKELNSMGIT